MLLVKQKTPFYLDFIPPTPIAAITIPTITIKTTRPRIACSAPEKLPSEAVIVLFAVGSKLTATSMKTIKPIRTPIDRLPVLDFKSLILKLSSMVSVFRT